METIFEDLLDAQAEISNDLFSELNINNIDSIFDDGLSVALDEIWLKCGEININPIGILNYKCLLCQDMSSEFENAASYEKHLTTHHPERQRKENRQDFNNCYFWINEMHPELGEKLELDYATQSVNFIDENNKAFKLDETEITDSSNDTTKTITSLDITTITTKRSSNHSESVRDYTRTASNNSRNSHHTNNIQVTTKKKNRKSGYCSVCNRVFNDQYNLRVHMMIHTGEQPFQCEECGKRFRQYNKLKVHRITHTNKKPFTCDICDKGFRFRNYLSVHKRLHSNDKPYKCRFCDEYFHSLHMRRLHMKAQHVEAKTFSCPVCAKVLTAQCYLTAHVKRHNNQRDYKCDRCDKSFFNRSQLKDHKMSHTNEKPYECNLCHTRFRRKSNYNQHLKIHSNIKSYVCTICNKGFAQNAGLYGHMRSHGGTTN